MWHIRGASVPTGTCSQTPHRRQTSLINESAIFDPLCLMKGSGVLLHFPLDPSEQCVPIYCLYRLQSNRFCKGFKLSQILRYRFLRYRGPTCTRLYWIGKYTKWLEYGLQACRFLSSTVYETHLSILFLGWCQVVSDLGAKWVSGPLSVRGSLVPVYQKQWWAIHSVTFYVENCECATLFYHRV